MLKHPLRVEKFKLGHEVEVDVSQTHQEVLHNEYDWCDKTKNG